MKRKELHALFNEVSSKCQPIRGIYTASPTERERQIKKELNIFREKETGKKKQSSSGKTFPAISPDHIFRAIQAMVYAPQENFYSG